MTAHLLNNSMLDDQEFIFMDDEFLLFEDDEEDSQAESRDGWTIMIVDDEKEVHEVTQLALQGFSFDNKELNFISAYSGQEAKRLIQQHPETAIILLDVVMESNHAGLMVAKYIREELGNYLVRIVLRTGQPGEAPENSVILDYDINDYRTKTELTQQKLITTIVSALRAYRDLVTTSANQKELENILSNVKERYEHVHHINENLQEEITKRKLTEVELREAKEAAEAANQAKGQFLATMSHELRAPLHAILGKSELLLEGSYGALSQPQHSSVRTLEQSGRHLLSLINDILDLAKIEAGKFALDIWPCAVEPICRISLQIMRPLAEAKALKLYFTMDPNVTMMYADERRLKQIFINLLNNAIKFTPSGGSVGLDVVGDVSGKKIHFIVWDTGIGIPAEDMERLFEPFVQLDNNELRHEGTGLGLSLVRSLTDKHGGTIEVLSEVGKGSRFTISLNHDFNKRQRRLLFQQKSPKSSPQALAVE
jgi:signal transduction histidine kinase